MRIVDAYRADLVGVVACMARGTGWRRRRAGLGPPDSEVRPEARGGVGTRLLEAALEWAVSQHVDRVVLWPTDRSRPLYLRHGFTADVDLLELELETRG